MYWLPLSRWANSKTPVRVLLFVHRRVPTRVAEPRDGVPPTPTPWGGQVLVRRPQIVRRTKTGRLAGVDITAYIVGKVLLLRHDCTGGHTTSNAATACSENYGRRRREPQRKEGEPRRTAPSEIWVHSTPVVRPRPPLPAKIDPTPLTCLARIGDVFQIFLGGGGWGSGRVSTFAVACCFLIQPTFHAGHPKHPLSRLLTFSRGMY